VFKPIAFMQLFSRNSRLSCTAYLEKTFLPDSIILIVLGIFRSLRMSFFVVLISTFSEELAVSLLGLEERIFFTQTAGFIFHLH
jgi:hypothetical protein